jgi:signal transduction histidine kinase
MSEPAASDFSLRILWSFARWIEDKKGRDALARVAASAAVRPEDFDGSTRWVSHAQLEKILEGGRELAGDEETFRSAFAYRFDEGYGAFRYMVWALSQQRMAQLAVIMSNKVLTNVSRFEVVYSNRSTFGFRYTSSRAESRLMCISRQMAWITAPTLRGLPSAELEEHACIAKGDPFCEYHVRWLDERGIALVLVGLAAGVAAAAVGATLDPSYTSAVALPLLGAAVGYVRELRRAGKLNVEHAKGIGAAMRSLGEAEAETRTEIVALQQRQHDWSGRMEEQANDRSSTLVRVVQGLDRLQQSRVSSLRGFSHDLRNPLYVVRANTRVLRERFRDGEEGEILRDMDVASSQIESMLGKLIDVATAEAGGVKLAPRPVLVAPLVDTLRRRLKALVHGRRIEVSVLCTRDAPGALLVDRLVFDRVVDNLLTNAAKYTERGSIRLEIGGTVPSRSDDPGCLSLKLSDTGRGIPAAQMERIFRPRPADELKGPNSYGIGLSSAIRLLGQIGGRLEVTSQPGVGSTFAAYFPTAPPEQKRTAADDNVESVISRVVRVVDVRSASGSSGEARTT